MKPTTIAFITARAEPELDWFFESLDRCTQETLGKRLNASGLRIIIVDFFKNKRPAIMSAPSNAIYVLPKPTVWSGEGRLTKDNWWSTANARNTALCLCQTEWIAFLDDRMVIQPGWLKCLLEAQAGQYVVAGAYEKRKDMTAVGGVIVHGGTVTGTDGREAYQKNIEGPNPMPCGGEWLFGANFALPLEWALEVNGVDESCDGAGGEDTAFGIHLQNAGKPIRYDSRMRIVEDRTPGKTGPVMRKEDKGVSPDDKSHALVKWLGPLKRAAHHWDIRKVREQALNGYGWPKAEQPTVDWYDQQPLKDMK